MEELTKLIIDNWQVIFLYALKPLNEMSKTLKSIDKTVAVHEAEINNLKKRQD